MELDKIMEMITKYGITTTLLAIIIFLLIYMAKANLLKDLIKSFTDKLKKKEKAVEEDTSKKIEISDSHIINHELFNYIDFWVYSKLPTMQIRTEFRTVVFKRYLHHQFKSYKDLIHVFVNDDSYKLLDNSQLRKKILKLITDIVFDYESKMRADGIPEVIINKMKAKNNDTLNLTIDLINSVCDSDLYVTKYNLLKMYTFLNIFHAILENMMTHCENASNELNGELSGLVFQGVKEPKSKGH